jgi:hypothetical protein
MNLDDFEKSPPSIELPEEEWRELEATLGVTEPNLDVRKEIACYVRRNLLSVRMDFPKHRTSAQKIWITCIQKKTQQLIDVLDWDASADESDDAYNQMYAVYDLLSASAQNSLLASLKELRNKAENTLARLPKGKSGRDRDEFSWALVFDLAFLYAEVTNKLPTITYNEYGDPDIDDYAEDGNVGIYQGPFLEFVAAVFRVFAPHRAKGNLALGKHIERVLKVWRRLPRPKDKTVD